MTPLQPPHFITSVPPAFPFLFPPFTPFFFPFHTCHSIFIFPSHPSLLGVPHFALFGKFQSPFFALPPSPSKGSSFPFSFFLLAFVKMVQATHFPPPRLPLPFVPKTLRFPQSKLALFFFFSFCPFRSFLSASKVFGDAGRTRPQPTLSLPLFLKHKGDHPTWLRRPVPTPPAQQSFFNY